MFGKLKEQMAGSATDKVVARIGGDLEPHIQALKQFKASDIQDDSLFESKITQPALIAIAAASSGVTQLIPGFNQKFSLALRHVRNELVCYDGDQVNLVDDYAERLPDVLKAGLAQPAA